jgi:hypothetical protein
MTRTTWNKAILWHHTSTAAENGMVLWHHTSTQHYWEQYYTWREWGIHDVNEAVLPSGIVKSYRHGNKTQNSIVTSYGTSYTTQGGPVTTLYWVKLWLVLSGNTAENSIVTCEESYIEQNSFMASAQVHLTECTVTHEHSISTLSDKVKQSHYRPGSGPEGCRRLRLPDFKTISTWRWQGCQPSTPATFTPRKYSWYSFLLEAESTPGP